MPGTPKKLKCPKCHRDRQSCTYGGRELQDLSSWAPGLRCDRCFQFIQNQALSGKFNDGLQWRCSEVPPTLGKSSSARPAVLNAAAAIPASTLAVSNLSTQVATFQGAASNGFFYQAQNGSLHAATSHADGSTSIPVRLPNVHHEHAFNGHVSSQEFSIRDGHYHGRVAQMMFGGDSLPLGMNQPSVIVGERISDMDVDENQHVGQDAVPPSSNDFSTFPKGGNEEKSSHDMSRHSISVVPDGSVDEAVVMAPRPLLDDRDAASFSPAGHRGAIQPFRQSPGTSNDASKHSNTAAPSGSPIESNPEIILVGAPQGTSSKKAKRQKKTKIPGPANMSSPEGSRRDNPQSGMRPVMATKFKGGASDTASPRTGTERRGKRSATSSPSPGGQSLPTSEAPESLLYKAPGGNVARFARSNLSPPAHSNLHRPHSKDETARRGFRYHSPPKAPGNTEFVESPVKVSEMVATQLHKLGECLSGLTIHSSEERVLGGPKVNFEASGQLQRNLLEISQAAFKIQHEAIEAYHHAIKTAHDDPPSKTRVFQRATVFRERRFCDRFGGCSQTPGAHTTAENIVNGRQARDDNRSHRLKLEGSPIGRALLQIPDDHLGYTEGVFSWCIAKREPLRLDELIEVLALNDAPDTEPISDPSDVEICVAKIHEATAGLITIDDSGMVQLSNEAREYITSGHSEYSISAPGANEYISNFLLRYLAEGNLQQDINSSGGRKSISQYCVKHSIDHIHQADLDEKLEVELVSSFLCSPGFEVWVSAYEETINFPPHLAGVGKPLVFSARFGLYDFARRLLKRNEPDMVSDALKREASQVAFENGHADVGALLCASLVYRKR